MLCLRICDKPSGLPTSDSGLATRILTAPGLICLKVTKPPARRSGPHCFGPVLAQLGTVDICQGLQEFEYAGVIAGVVSELCLAANLDYPRLMKARQVPAQSGLRYADLSRKTVDVLFVVRQKNADLKPAWIGKLAEKVRMPCNALVLYCVI
jgi:hypothetical protein